MKWIKDVNHDCDEAAFKRLRKHKTRFTRGAMTSEGLKYRCQLLGCDVETTSRVGAAIHEAEHSGIDLLTETNAEKLARSTAVLDQTARKLVDEKARQTGKTPPQELRDAALSQR
mgnify:CR=1 FL=1